MMKNLPWIFSVKKKILLIHGGGFNWKEPDHFRVVYLPRVEVLEKAARNIADFLRTYQQKLKLKASFSLSFIKMC